MEEITINYHITEKCNYSCFYCFAKYNINIKDEVHNNIENVEKMLKDTFKYFAKKYSSNIRLNFAGGEPLLLGDNFDKIIYIAKKIGYKLSLITNGSNLSKEFIEKHSINFSMIGISIDSFNKNTNIEIGRYIRNNKVLAIDELKAKIDLARKINKNLVIKINTVVNEYNYQEAMIEQINKLNPEKWKIFKVLPYENKVKQLCNDKFNEFIITNRGKVNIYLEDNEDMINSYIMIDPVGRFYQNNNNGGYKFSEQISLIGIEKAFNQVGYNKDKYNKRYGQGNDNI